MYTCKSNGGKTMAKYKLHSPTTQNSHSKHTHVIQKQYNTKQYKTKKQNPSVITPTSWLESQDDLRS